MTDSLSTVKPSTDSLPEIAGVEERSSAHVAGVQVGDKVVTVNGVSPRDILEWQRLVDGDEVELQLLRGNLTIDVVVERVPGQPFGASISSAVFDRIHTCDNHCEFCFIYQLPKGMRKSLYLKDDDYRLSFLFGNFTTLTRFTEADLERVIEEQLSPIYVSVHSMSPHLRSDMLRNNRGGFSLRWMKVLLQNGIEVKAQIVLCPGVNDKDALDDTLAGLLEECPELQSIAIVPLGLSKFNTEGRMRVHTTHEAALVVKTVTTWQHRFETVLDRQPIHLADEFYLVAGEEVPKAETYGDFPMLEDGVGLARSFVDAFKGLGPDLSGRQDGFFSSVDSPTDYVRVVNPAGETGLRPMSSQNVHLRKREIKPSKPLAVLTGSYGARIMKSLFDSEGFVDVEIVEVKNDFFGGNTAVAGLLTYEDILATLRGRGDNRRYLLPDVCLNDGVFLDGGTVEALSSEFDVEVIATSGAVLRKRLEEAKEEFTHV